MRRLALPAKLTRVPTQRTFGHTNRLARSPHLRSVHTQCLHVSTRALFLHALLTGVPTHLTCRSMQLSSRQTQLLCAPTTALLFSGTALKIRPSGTKTSTTSFFLTQKTLGGTALGPKLHATDFVVHGTALFGWATRLLVQATATFFLRSALNASARRLGLRGPALNLSPTGTRRSTLHLFFTTTFANGSATRLFVYVIATKRTRDRSDRHGRAPKPTGDPPNGYDHPPRISRDFPFVSRYRDYVLR